MDLHPNKLDFEQQKARELLDELDNIPGPGEELEFWNIKAKALLVFAAMKLHCTENIEANQ